MLCISVESKYMVLFIAAGAVEGSILLYLAVIWRICIARTKELVPDRSSFQFNHFSSPSYDVDEAIVFYPCHW